MTYLKDGEIVYVMNRPFIVDASTARSPRLLEVEISNEHAKHLDKQLAVESCYECFPLGYRIGG